MIRLSAPALSVSVRIVVCAVLLLSCVRTQDEALAKCEGKRRERPHVFKDWKNKVTVNLTESREIMCKQKKQKKCDMRVWQKLPYTTSIERFDVFSPSARPRVYSEQHMGLEILTLQHVRESDAGQYRCYCCISNRVFYADMTLEVVGIPSAPNVSVHEPKESRVSGTVHVANLITPTPFTKQDVTTVLVTSFPHVLPTESVTEIQSTDVDLEGIRTAEATSSISAYVVVVPCLLIVLGLLCVLVGIWLIRRWERARGTRLPPDDWEKIGESIEEEAFRVVVDKNHGWKTFHADNETVNQKNQTQNEEVEKKEPSGGIEFPRSKLTLGTTLGNGHFGIVREAQAQYLHSGQVTTTVAVKSVKDVDSIKDTADLSAEAAVMMKVGRHENVVSLLGVCSVNGPLWLIVEYALNGNLKNYLHSKRIHKGVGPTASTASDASYKSTLTYSASLCPVSERDMFWYGAQIALGMEYLESKQCVHRDLAARNVLVFENDTLKISDFGMAKDIHYFEYYKTKPGTSFLPIKWTAPEALMYKVYTEASDVWSFGIVLWEIATLGGTPYPSIPVERLFDCLTNTNYRMGRPRKCPQKLYEMMRSCWENEPEERPPFRQLTERFNDILEEMPLTVIDEKDLNDLSGTGDSNLPCTSSKSNQLQLETASKHLSTIA